MKKIAGIFLVILFCAMQASAQDQGDVVVHSDPRLGVLMKKTKTAAAASTHSSRPMAYANEPGKKPVHLDSAHAVSSGTSATTKPASAPATEASTPAESPKPARAPIYIREKEGRVLYAGKGFRVQIYSGNDREKAIAIKTEVMRRYPATRTYLSYISPTFRVKVGDYRTRAEAAGMQRELRESYSPCVIVPANITINSK